MSDPDVVIVGAGAAGVSAARRLANRGHAVLLVDALDRIGGRAWTATVAGLPLDLGCGWLHSAERNPWVAVAEAYGHAVDRTPTAWGTQWRNLGFPAGDQDAAWGAFAGWEARLRDPLPGDCAVDALPAGGEWNAYIDALSGYINGAPLAELSIADYVSYDDAASEANWRLPRGYGALVEAEAAGLPRALGTIVSEIAHAPGGVTLATDRGTLRARAAIVTVPSDVLAAGALRLPPGFAPAIAAAACVPLGLADKLFLSIADAEALPVDGHLLGNPHDPCTGSYYLRPFGRPVIEGFFGGRAARALEAAGDSARVDFAIGELRALLGGEVADGLNVLAASCWGRVPSIRGSYSHALPGHAAARAVLAARHDERILLAGEACSAHDFSTAHGARATGLAAADALAEVLR